MLNECSYLMNAVRGHLQELVPLLDKLQLYCEDTSNLFNPVELVDVAFAARETEDHIDAFLKRLRMVSRVSQQRANIAMEALGIDKVRTDYCTASPNPKPWYKISYKRDINPERWDQIMNAIGVNAPASTQELVRFHAPSLMDYCGSLLGEGSPPPAGINPKEMTSMELNLRITRTRTA